MIRSVFLATMMLMSVSVWAQNVLVFQSDFGTRDGAVAAMKGVAISVSSNLQIQDLTHEIPTFNIWEAALRLEQTARYWPPGTVFVSVVDPGVGTQRKSVVLKTKSGHYFVTPDNGTLTFVAESLGIEALREIDEAVNRLQNSDESYTFHGRDVYAYTGARLAAGIISFQQVGRKLEPVVVSIPYQRASIQNGEVKGNIPILDPQFGNVWTNIGRQTFQGLNLQHGDLAQVTISKDDTIVFDAGIPFHGTFGAVTLGNPLLYLNSLNNVALALNQGDFAGKFKIQSGAGWTISISLKK